MLTKAEISNKIMEIIHERLHIHFEAQEQWLEEEALLGSAFGLTPYELAYLKMEVEREFRITIPERALLSPGIKTVEDFTNSVLEYREEL